MSLLLDGVASLVSTIPALERLESMRRPSFPYCLWHCSVVGVCRLVLGVLEHPSILQGQLREQGFSPDRFSFHTCGSYGLRSVAEALKDSDTLVEQVSPAVLHLWRFRPWTDSGWITMGESSRTVLLAILTGIDSLIDRIRGNPRHSDYHIHGWSRVTPNVRYFLCVASMCCFVADSFLAEAMEDDRVASRLGRMEERVAEEVSFLAGLSGETWACIAEVAGSAPAVLRAVVLHGAHLVAAFMSCRVLIPARGVPWALGRGCIADSLAKLKEGPTPEDETALEIFRLFHLGMSPYHIEQAIELMMQVGWSTFAVERGHGAASSLNNHTVGTAPRH